MNNRRLHVSYRQFAEPRGRRGLALVVRWPTVFAVAAVLGFNLPSTAHAERLQADRVAVVFTASELGGPALPRFIWQRELAFLARLEALADAGFENSAPEPYLDRHVRSALERAVAETLLEGFEIDPKPNVDELKRRAIGARLIVAQRVGGAVAVVEAAQAEGIADLELWRIFQRQARASLYLDRMVTPMLEPSVAELKALHQGAATPFSGQPFEQAREGLRRWYVGGRLSRVLSAFYETARSRIKVEVMSGWGSPRSAASSAQ